MIKKGKRALERLNEDSNNVKSEILEIDGYKTFLVEERRRYMKNLSDVGKEKEALRKSIGMMRKHVELLREKLVKREEMKIKLVTGISQLNDSIYLIK